MPNLTSINDLDDEAIRQLLAAAARFKANPEQHDLLADKIVAMAFFEPSTRTRLSFEAAAHRLGAKVIGFADGQSSSASKGETLADTVRVLSGYCDALVLRHPENGAAKEATSHSGVPVVNAGDGTGEHPSQTLVDLFTIQEALGSIDGKRVAILGDLANGRTVHSLVPALQRFGATVVQVPAAGLEYPGEIPIVSLEDAAASSHVLYATRVQLERASLGEAPIIDAALLARTQSRAIVMHPLPRVNELATDVDNLPAAKYFEQARNGVPVRMAILAKLLDVL